jgi:hypothetical protein
MELGIGRRLWGWRIKRVPRAGTPTSADVEVSILEITADTSRFEETLRRVQEAIASYGVTLDEYAAAWARLVSAMPIDFSPQETPVGEIEITPILLEECWRCSATIPREDELGLCAECKVGLQDLADQNPSGGTSPTESNAAASTTGTTRHLQLTDSLAGSTGSLG